MNIKAIIFMHNDHARLDFTLGGFSLHNPEIPVHVVNNGGPDVPVAGPYLAASAIAKKYGYSYEAIPNMWQKNEWEGSFGYAWFEKVFEYAFANRDASHILTLETDVFTKKKITREPKFDMSGFCATSGPVVNRTMYDHFNLAALGFGFDYGPGDRSYLQTGCGGTIYRLGFFDKAFPNLGRIKKAYETVGHHCFADCLMTMLCYISGCTLGQWEETTQNGAVPWYQCQGFNPDAAMIHNYKV